MGEIATLKAVKREVLGSRHSRRLRVEGRLPANVQGLKDKPHIDIHIDEKEFLSARRQRSLLFEIEVGGETETAVVRELQWDVLGTQIQHVEFRRVVRGVKVESEGGLLFTGHPKAGIVHHMVETVRILSIPIKIPDGIEVNVNELESGTTILASDLVMPEGVTLVIPLDTQIAAIREARHVVMAGPPPPPRTPRRPPRAARPPPRPPRRTPDLRADRPAGSRGPSALRSRPPALEYPAPLEPRGADRPPPAPERLDQARRRPGQPRPGLRGDPPQRGFHGAGPPGRARGSDL